ncbi:peptide chain release factor N(5)-glutamine methyltransferase, partial [Candidatus Pelagibacter sp.]|nr:peptide chain release factor N(5)-glutamine methyltransferase [Candidatus Pelagibacter sp.]
MNYLETINYGNKILKSQNINSYNLDSELILANVLNSTREEILTNLNKKVDDINFNKYNKLIFRRKNNEPIAYILQNKEFWKNNFIVDKNVLIPRPETEIIVDEVLKLTNFNSSKQFLDIGTGSGC